MSPNRHKFLADALHEYDHRVNVRWKMAHLRSAVEYLHNRPEDIRATSGTNWQTYLPPVQQQRQFFPSLWSAGELQHWGKSAHRADYRSFLKYRTISP